MVIYWRCRPAGRQVTGEWGGIAELHLERRDDRGVSGRRMTFPVASGEL